MGRKGTRVTARVGGIVGGVGGVETGLYMEVDGKGLLVSGWMVWIVKVGV